MHTDWERKKTKKKEEMDYLVLIGSERLDSPIRGIIT